MAIAKVDNGIVKLVPFEAAEDGCQQPLVHGYGQELRQTQVDHEIGAYHNNR